MNHSLIMNESDIHDLMSSSAYLNSHHPEHKKTHQIVRDWFVYRYNDHSEKQSLASLTPWKNIGDTLLVGEGNLSFARSLLEYNPSKIASVIASTYESERTYSADTKENAEYLKRNGAKVLDKIDSAHLDKIFISQKFDSIIFQFPNAGSREPIHGHNPNYILLRKFLKSAAQIIKPNGKILVSTVDTPYYEGAFQFEEAAQFAGLNITEILNFDPDMFPGYTHSNTNDDDSAIKDHQKFVTRVFKKKP